MAAHSLKPRDVQNVQVHFPRAIGADKNRHSKTVLFHVIYANIRNYEKEHSCQPLTGLQGTYL